MPVIVPARKRTGRSGGGIAGSDPTALSRWGARGVRALLNVLLAGSLWNCRDGVAPYAPPGYDLPTGQVYRLTYAPGDDRDPSWNAAGDSIYYWTTDLAGAPPAPAVLARISLTGGIVAFPLADIQEQGYLLARPVTHGARLAFLQLVSAAPRPPSNVNDPCGFPEPLLDSAIVFVRALDRPGRLSSDSARAIGFQGRDPAQKAALPDPYYQHAYPFQNEYTTDGALLFGPSWSPGGEELVFSDGLQLYRWTPGGTTVSAIPGTDGGVSPVWSPAGDQIAFTRFVVADSTTNSCALVTPKRTIMLYRTGYGTISPHLVITTPDGSAQSDLGSGAEPAWAPDGTLYYRQGNVIVARAPGSDTITPVTGTERGHAPAVSPDGRWLAFARRNLDAGDYDLWIVALQP